MNLEKLKRIVLAFVAVLLCAVSGTAAAQGYIGAGAGLTNLNACDDLTAAGATTCDDEDTGLKIFGGYKFNPNFAIEGAWVDLGEVSASDGFVTVMAEVDGIQVAAVGMIPLSEKWGLFGKVGLFLWDATVSATGLGSASDDGNDIMFGGGVSWALTKTFGLRAEFERFDVLDGEDVDFISIGAQFNF